MGNELGGRVAIITGAGRGIGRALGRRLADEGMAVALVARTGSEVESLRDEIIAAGGDALAFAADVADRGAVELIVARTTDELGPPWMLVNNAARSASWDGTRLWDADPEDWWGRIETNLRGPFLFAHAVLGGMVERGEGYVIAMNSLAGAAALSMTDGAYPVSKSALFRLTDQLASQLGGTGVVAIDLSPGLVRTSANDGSDDDGGVRWTPVGAICDLVVRVGHGDFDGFSGRFLHATDDLDEVASHLAEIVANDTRVLRMLPGWPTDQKMIPYWGPPPT
jgi:3-oxoacyl-[acyl-carrier protein] reductase